MDKNVYDAFEERKYCPFLLGKVDGECRKDRCALWHQKKNDRGEDVSKCGLLMASYALAHLATVGMDVYPG